MATSSQDILKEIAEIGDWFFGVDFGKRDESVIEWTPRYIRKHTPGERVSVFGELLYRTYGDGSVYMTNDWERMMRR